MLNIKTRFSLTKKSKRHIKKHIKRIGYRLKSDSWDVIGKSVKNEISQKLFNKHGIRCVYCERYLMGQSPQIDHFAHKGKFPQFTFIPVNLFYSCSFCNSPSRKGQKSTIQNVHSYYKQCTFEIVHPYFDDPDNEIKYKDSDRIDLDFANCTTKGKETIEYFGFDDPIMTFIRARTVKNERDYPLTSVEEKSLIQEMISYK